MDIITQAKQKREEYVAKTQIIIDEFFRELENCCFEILKYSIIVHASILFRRVKNTSKPEEAVLIADISAKSENVGQWYLTIKQATEIYGNSFNTDTTLHLLEDSLKKQLKAKESGSSYIITQSNFPKSAVERHKVWINGELKKAELAHSLIMKAKAEEKMQRENDLKVYNMMLSAFDLSFESLSLNLYRTLVDEEFPKIALKFDGVSLLLNTTEKRLIIKQNNMYRDVISYVLLPTKVIEILECKPDTIISSDYTKGVFAEELVRKLAERFYGVGLWERGWSDDDFVVNWANDAELFPICRRLYKIRKNADQKYEDFRERRLKELVKEFSALFSQHLQNKERLREDIKRVFGEFLSSFVENGCSTITVTVQNQLFMATGKGQKPLPVSKMLAFTQTLPLYPHEEITNFSKKDTQALKAVTEVLDRDLLPLIMDVIRSEFSQCYSYVSDNKFIMNF